jgi:tripartite-type tricarboxylate transporter receptor subunit TctC
MKMAHVRGTRFVLNVAVSAALAAGAVGVLAQQQPYPSRPVRLIVPLAPGGTTDIMARTMAQQLAASLGQQVVVENRAGAGGTVGSDFVAKSAADGYTLLIISADTYTTNAVLYTKLPFDARKDLRPLSILAASPSLLTVHPSLPVKSVAQLVALSKARPNDLNYGSGGTSGQLRMELLKFNTGMHITNIPYKGSGPALVDQMAGHVHVGFFNLVATAPFVLSGKLRGIVVTGSKRSDKLPAVPSTKESGVKGFDENVGYLMLAPGATPKDIVSRLNADIVKVLRGPEVSSRLAAEGSEVVGSTPEQATTVVNQQLDQWADVVRRTGIKLQ